MSRHYHSSPMTTGGRTCHVGSRASVLAMIQTESVVRKLSDIYPEIKLPIKKITTTGDKIQGVALAKIGEKAVFTKELEVALEQKVVQFVVHSLKDLPTTLPPGMIIGAVLHRDSPFDACIMSRKNLEAGHARLSDLPSGSVVGTSSLRRIAQLRRLHPGLMFKDVRGNLNTRMKKLDAEPEPDEGIPNYAALILAESGMARMGWSDRITRSIPSGECLYAVGQGALAVECREDDLDTLSLLSFLHHESTTYRVVAERAFLKVLDGGCSATVAVETTFWDGQLMLKGGVYSLDGVEELKTSLTVDLSPYLQEEDNMTSATSKRTRSSRSYAGIRSGTLNESAMEATENLGIGVAKRLKEMGAGPILAAAKAEVESERVASEKIKQEAIASAAAADKQAAADLLVSTEDQAPFLVHSKQHSNKPEDS
jgi:hydroxymethylbilane synthase